MTSNLLAGLQPTSDDLQPTSWPPTQPASSHGLQPNSDGLEPTSDDLQPTSWPPTHPTCSDGLQPNGDGLQAVASNLLAMASNLQPKMDPEVFSVSHLLTLRLSQPSRAETLSSRSERCRPSLSFTPFVSDVSLPPRRPDSVSRYRHGYPSQLDVEPSDFAPQPLAANGRGQAATSFLLLVAMPGAPSRVLVPSSDALCS